MKSFVQLLVEKELFSDKIKKLKIASEFNNLIRIGHRKDTGVEAYKIWARMFLKMVIKDEYYIYVASKFEELDLKLVTRHHFGAIVDGVFSILKGDNTGINVACRIDDMFKTWLPSLLRIVYQIKNREVFKS